MFHYISGYVTVPLGDWTKAVVYVSSVLQKLKWDNVINTVQVWITAKKIFA